MTVGNRVRVRMQLATVPAEDDPHAELAAYGDATNKTISIGLQAVGENAQRFVSTGEA